MADPVLHLVVGPERGGQIDAVRSGDRTGYGARVRQRRSDCGSRPGLTIRPDGRMTPRRSLLTGAFAADQRSAVVRHREPCSPPVETRSGAPGGRGGLSDHHARGDGSRGTGGGPGEKPGGCRRPHRARGQDPGPLPTSLAPRGRGHPARRQRHDLDNSRSRRPFRVVAVFERGRLVESGDWPAWAPDAIRPRR